MESKKKAIASWQATETPRHRDADTHGFEQSESFGRGRRSGLHYKHGFTDIGIGPYRQRPNEADVDSAAD